MRAQIVDVMRSYGQPISPTQLARITGESLGSVAYHVRTLTGAGIVALAEEGRVRGAVEHFYELVHDDQAHLSDPTTQLLALCGSLTVPRPDGAFPRPVALDDAGRQDLNRIIETIKPRVREIAAASTKRASTKRAR